MMFVVTLFSMQAICVRSNTVRRLGGTPKGCIDPKDNHGEHARRALLAQSPRMPWANAGDTEEAVISQRGGNIKSPPCALRRRMLLNHPRNPMLATSTRRRLVVSGAFRFVRQKSLSRILDNHDLLTAHEVLERLRHERNGEPELSEPSSRQSSKHITNVNMDTRSSSNTDMSRSENSSYASDSSTPRVPLVLVNKKSIQDASHRLAEMQAAEERARNEFRKDANVPVFKSWASVIEAKERLAEMKRQEEQFQKAKADLDFVDGQTYTNTMVDGFLTTALFGIDVTQVVKTCTEGLHHSQMITELGYIGAILCGFCMLYYLFSFGASCARFGSNNVRYTMGLLIPVVVTGVFGFTYLLPDIAGPDSFVNNGKAFSLILGGIFLALPFFLAWYQSDHCWRRMVVRSNGAYCQCLEPLKPIQDIM